jgi:hypothetical protein
MKEPLLKQETISKIKISVASVYLAVCVVCCITIGQIYPNEFEVLAQNYGLVVSETAKIFKVWIICYAVLVWSATLISIYSIR